MEHAHIIESARRQLEMLKMMKRTGHPDEKKKYTLYILDVNSYLTNSTEYVYTADTKEELVNWMHENKGEIENAVKDVKDVVQQANEDSGNNYASIQLELFVAEDDDDDDDSDEKEYKADIDLKNIQKAINQLSKLLGGGTIQPSKKPKIVSKKKKPTADPESNMKKISTVDELLLYHGPYGLLPKENQVININDRTAILLQELNEDGDETGYWVYRNEKGVIMYTKGKPTSPSFVLQISFTNIKDDVHGAEEALRMVECAYFHDARIDKPKIMVNVEEAIGSYD
jgi:predicted transcriptional regulator